MKANLKILDLFVLIYIVTVSYLLGFPKEVNDLRNDLISTQNETSLLCELNNSLFDVDSDCADSVNKLCDVTYSKESRIELVNGELVPLTEAEIAEVEALRAAAPSQEEIKWARVRMIRNEKLKLTDWRASSDLTLSDEWKTYRQALRDVPTQTDPDNITWPTEPS